MNTKLYVGNLSYDAQESAIKELFSQYGTVSDFHLPLDRETNRPRGFAFVTLEEGGKEAMEKLNGYSFEGRELNVTEARPKEERSFSNSNSRNNDSRKFSSNRY
jgi:RNA recognition motif-containing protein